MQDQVRSFVADGWQMVLLRTSIIQLISPHVNLSFIRDSDT